MVHRVYLAGMDMLKSQHTQQESTTTVQLVAHYHEPHAMRPPQPIEGVVGSDLMLQGPPPLGGGEARIIAGSMIQCRTQGRLQVSSRPAQMVACTLFSGRRTVDSAAFFALQGL